MATKSNNQTLLGIILLAIYTAIAIGATILWSRIIWVAITMLTGVKAIQWGIASILLGTLGWCIFIIVRGISRDIKSDKKDNNQ